MIETHWPPRGRHVVSGGSRSMGGSAVRWVGCDRGCSKGWNSRRQWESGEGEGKSVSRMALLSALVRLVSLSYCLPCYIYLVHSATYVPHTCHTATPNFLAVTPLLRAVFLNKTSPRISLVWTISPIRRIFTFLAYDGILIKIRSIIIIERKLC